MLPRSHAELYETLRDFVVEEQAGKIVGVCALEIVWADLAELKSLAVHPDCHRQGLGRQLVTAILEQAKLLQIPRVFTLTYEQAFFERFGFVVVDKSALPHKVWSDCIKCPKRDRCDEIAMVNTLSPPGAYPTVPEEEGHGHYEVPTPLTKFQSK